MEKVETGRMITMITDVKTEGSETTVIIKCGVDFRIERTKNSFTLVDGFQPVARARLTTTPDENEVNSMVERGMNYKDIAIELGCGYNTLKRYRKMWDEKKSRADPLPDVKIDIGDNNEDDLMEVLERSRAPYGSKKK